MRTWALDGNGRLSGGVTFGNFEDFRLAGEAHIRESRHGAVEFDCSGLEEANSIAVALLIAWRRAAGGCGKTVAFRGASVGLRDIAAFSGLSDVLPLEGR